MPRKKVIKKMEAFFKEVECTPEVKQQRLDQAFDILFEETLKFINTNKSFLPINKDFKFLMGGGDYI